jgi:hypothetical protein
MLYVVVVLLLFIVYLYLDYRGPAYVNLKTVSNAEGKSQKAKELIVQEYDHEGNLWASRGMILYCQNKGELKYKRMAHIPTGLSFYFLYNFSLFRRLVNKPECIVATITGDRHICVMSAGFIWQSALKKPKFKKVFTLRHFGMGVGRGIFSNGIVSVGQSQIYFGEYFRNSNRSDVRIYVSRDSGSTWEVAYEFKPGKVRHVHSIQEDPYDGKLWVTCGDLDSESIIIYSDDEFKTIHEIGSGHQGWRTCQLVFAKEKIFWGGDNGEIEYSGIYCWDKSSAKVSKICKIEGAILYGNKLPGGNLIFTTDREGFKNEFDDKTRIVLIKSNGEVSLLNMGSWKYAKKGFRYSFAMLRLPRNQKNSILSVSVINQKEYPMGELLAFDESLLEKLNTNVIKPIKYEKTSISI